MNEAEYHCQPAAESVIRNNELPSAVPLAGMYALMRKNPDLSPRAQEARNLLFQDLYDPRMPLLLAQIQAQNPQSRSLIEAVAQLESLELPILTEMAHTGAPPHQAFQTVFTDALGGENHLFTNARIARSTAARAIYFHLPEDPAAQEVLHDFVESKFGSEIPPSILDQLQDPNKRTVVCSLDINSTFNNAESFGLPYLNARTQAEMERFASQFRAIFPDKQLVMAINTGRPGQYAWGFAEGSFSPDPSLRTVAVAESGGVLIDDFETGQMHVAVEHPGQWKKELDNIQAFMLAQIKNPEEVHIEPKQSMLSIQVSDRAGKFLLISHEGNPVDQFWVQAKLQKYFNQTAKQLDAEYDELTQDVTKEIPAMTEYVSKAVEAYKNGNGNGNGTAHKEEMLKEFAETMKDIDESHQMRAKAIEMRLAILKVMDEELKLEVNFNPTAGYIDIGHKDLNKFSTLMKYMCKVYNVTPEQVCYFHLGDSTTDIIPDENTAKGEPNEGAQEAVLVGVANSNAKLTKAIEDRGSQGMVTRRPSTLGVRDFFRGLNREIAQIRKWRT